ncbi:MAG: hypothetical protein SGPRY_009740, partial [Prymnesium sp.]
MHGDITLRMSTDALALATIDELSNLLKLFEGALPSRKETSAASWAAKLTDACLQEIERMDEAAAPMAKEKPCDWCRQASVIGCTLCGLKNVHHFCQNEMVPVLVVNMALRLCTWSAPRRRLRESASEVLETTQ